MTGSKYSNVCRTAEAREARQLEAGKDFGGDSAHATRTDVDPGTVDCPHFQSSPRPKFFLAYRGHVHMWSSFTYVCRVRVL